MIGLLNPWALLGIGVAVISAGGVGYWQGHDTGYDDRVAEESAAKDESFQKFANDAKTTIENAAREAAAELDVKIATLDGVGRRLSAARGPSDAAINELAGMLRANGCVLTPDQRMRAESFRRPIGLGLPDSPEASLPAPLSGTGPRPAAPPGR